MKIIFRRFQSRLILFFSAIFIIIQSLMLYLVSVSNYENAKSISESQLEEDFKVFSQLIYERTETLLEYARIMSSDYGFKQAYFSDDRSTIESALHNQLFRLHNADVMFVTNNKSMVVAESIQGLTQSQQWKTLLKRAQDDDYSESTGIIKLNNDLYRVVVVPLLAPDIVAWIHIGFKLDKLYLEKFKSITLTEFSLFEKVQDSQVLYASTLASNMTLLNKSTPHLTGTKSKASIQTIDDQQWLSLFSQINTDPNIVVLLNRSLDKAIEPLLVLQNILYVLFSFGLVIILISCYVIARKVSQPVKALNKAVALINEGNYSSRVSVNSNDEIGELSKAFNSMADGLSEKERVRDLLGKMVSKEIATELLTNSIELGGEEKIVTVLFADIRNFTDYCEPLSPKDILNMLNIYLSFMSESIESHHGVVDKFVGDAIMALFGAPVTHERDAKRAVHAALSMIDQLPNVNTILHKHNYPAIDIGVGINTSSVVAGNMGSDQRMNYTVIGDGVNLASRLEGLTKFYGVPIIVSEDTMQACPEIVFKKLDCVQVKGRKKPVSIFQPISQPNTTELDQYHEALELYRSQNWVQAKLAFQTLFNTNPDKLNALYLQRIEKLLNDPFDETWKAVTTFDQK